MNKIFVLGVAMMLSGSMLLPAVMSNTVEDMNEKVTVKVRTFPGTISEIEVSPAVGARLQSIINQLNNHTDSYKTLLPALLNILEDYGLIKDTESMKHAIMEHIQYSSKQAYVSDWSLFFNFACFIVGYGNSNLMTPAMLLSIILARIHLLPYLLGFALLAYQDLRPRLSVPIGGWFVNSGGMQTLGLFGHKSYTRDLGNVAPLPALILVFGFTGLWISLLIKGIEYEYFIGSAIAVFGG